MEKECNNNCNNPSFDQFINLSILLLDLNSISFTILLQIDSTNYYQITFDKCFVPHYLSLSASPLITKSTQILITDFLHTFPNWNLNYPSCFFIVLWWFIISNNTSISLNLTIQLRISYNRSVQESYFSYARPMLKPTRNLFFTPQITIGQFANLTDIQNMC